VPAAAALLLCTLMTGVAAAPADPEERSRADEINTRLASILKQFPEADADGNRELTLKEATAFLAARATKLQKQLGAAAALGNLPGGLAVDRDVTYGKGPDAAHQKLDILYHKDSEQLRPAIVMIHGGGFRAGSKAAFHPLMRDFALQGYVTLSVTYRFSQIAPFPAQVADCKLAVRWLRAHAEKYGVDPKRVGVTGASAGAYLAAMLALTDSADGFDGHGAYREQSSSVQAAVPLCGAYDVRPPALRRAGMSEADWENFLGEAPSANPGLALKASPVAHASRHAPPFLIIHADNDLLAPAFFASDLAQALETAGARCALCLVKGAAHGWPLAYETDVPQRMAAFFARWLRNERAAKQPARDGKL
jgi:acetyl esterase/lipase